MRLETSGLRRVFWTRMRNGPYLLGVAGGSGSGKTTLIRALRERLPAGTICLVSQDDYYLPIDKQEMDVNGKVNFDLPKGIDLDLLADDLRCLAKGETIYRQEYTFNLEGAEPKWMEVKPAPVIVVEGLFVMHHAPVREQFDLKVFVEASEDVQLQRRLDRDARERGYGEEEVRYQWHNHVMPAYREYLLPYRAQCDLHVINEHRFDKAVSVLCDHLKQVSGVAELVELSRS
jgi:uridine kinase